jgi:hypothetical protein
LFRLIYKYERAFLIFFFLICIAADLPAQASANAIQTDLISRYDLTVKILPDEHRIEVTGTMLLRLRQRKRQRKFVLWSRMENLSVQIIEPKIAVPLLELINDGADGDRTWTVKPGRPFPAGEPILLRFSYNSDGKILPAIQRQTGRLLCGRRGRALVSADCLQRARGRHPAFKTAPPGETAISNGESVSTETQKAGGEFVFRIAKPVKFAFAAGKYRTFRRAGKIPLTLYLLKPREHAQKLADNSAKALDFLTGLFGEFPYKEMSLVEVIFKGESREQASSVLFLRTMRSLTFIIFPTGRTKSGINGGEILSEANPAQTVK